MERVSSSKVDSTTKMTSPFVLRMVYFLVFSDLNSYDFSSRLEYISDRKEPVQSIDMDASSSLFIGFMKKERKKE